MIPSFCQKLKLSFFENKMKPSFFGQTVKSYDTGEKPICRVSQDYALYPLQMSLELIIYNIEDIIVADKD